MDRRQWDGRHRGVGLVRTATPNQFAVAESEGAEPRDGGRSRLGDGPNAVWPADQGRSLTGVDLPAEGPAKGARLAASGGVEVAWGPASVHDGEAPAGGVDLVVMRSLQLPRPERSAAPDDAAGSGGLAVGRADRAVRVVETVDGPREAVGAVVRADRSPAARTAGAK